MPHGTENHRRGRSHKRHHALGRPHMCTIAIGDTHKKEHHHYASQSEHVHTRGRSHTGELAHGEGSHTETVASVDDLNGAIKHWHNRTRE